jgi:hypothetical protein
MKRRVFALLFVSLISMAGQSSAGDTGTYRILNYRVGLTPRSDGTVTMEYYQKWLVTGGHIPWITVGTPNSNFAVAGSGGAAARIASASQSGWSGVRLDLDRDYQPGQTFDVRFSIVQRGLFYASKENYELGFTPGWYDRAVTDTLSVKFFASLKTVTPNPRPSSVSDDEMVWEKHGLAPGERFTIHVSFPVGLFPSGIAEKNLKRGSSDSLSGARGVFVFMFVAVIVVIVIMALFANKRRYSGGNIFYGGMPGGRLGRGASGSGRSTGGGGGFGGASISCACACVSCACACACAGGGGAGCSRKLEHTCPICENKR